MHDVVLKQAQSWYFELFCPYSELPLNRRKFENNDFRIQKKHFILIMVEDGEDSNKELEKCYA